MAREVKERQIGPHTYRLKQLGAKHNTEALEECMRLFGPTLGGAADGLVRGGDDWLTAAFLAAGNGLAAFCATVPPGSIWHLVELFTKGDNGQTVVRIEDSGEESGYREPRLLDAVDDLWSGDRYADMFEWLAWAMRENFESFFADSARTKRAVQMAKIAFAEVKAKAKGESQSPSPSMSTG